MAKFDVFVGRKEELALVDEWVQKWDTTHLIAVQGDGGVGKTWLLLEILRRYGGRDNLAVAYFDAAEHPLSLQYEMMFLVQRLGEDHFPESLAGMEALTRSYYDLPIQEVQDKEDQVFQLFTQEANRVLADRRLVFLSDTLEMLAYGREVSTAGARFNELAAQFSNTLFVSAGRNAKEFMPIFIKDFGAEHVTYLELHNFDRVESAKFFDAADVHGFIAPDLRDKLYFLTDGRPVLLSLAVEWLSRDVPLPEISERSLQDLKDLPAAALYDLRERFEFELVDQVRKLQNPLDRAVLYMAHISRRNDARILALLLDLPVPEAEALIGQLADLSFVRYNPMTGNCTLHDEMKNLVNQHAWPYVDPTGDVRRKLTCQVITDYYAPRIEALARQTRAQLEPGKGPVRRATIGGAEWEQWRLEAECLHYYLKLGAQEGMDYFDARFGEAQREKHHPRMQFLLNEMEVAGHIGIRDTLALRRAAALRLEGQAEQAAEICQGLLARGDLSPDNRIMAHNLLGVIAASKNPEAAREHYETALRLAQEQNRTQLVGVLHNNLGQLHQLTSQLDQAVTHYQEAIEASRAADNQPLVASARNNLAYVYRRQGDLWRANGLCRVALLQRKQLGLERDLAYSYLTKGEIDRDRGDLESAERYTKLALRSFDKVDEVGGQIMAYRSLANIRRHLEQYEQAEAYIKRGVELAEQAGDEPLLASLFNVYGREQRDRAVYLAAIGEQAVDVAALYSRAEAYLERSLALATQYGDQWLITRSRFELALTYFLSRSRPDEYVSALLDQVWASATHLDEKLLQGYVQEARGEIAGRHGAHETAARHFGAAALLIAQRRGREPQRFFDRLGDRLLDPELSYEAIRTLARGILTVIETSADIETHESLQSLQMLCQHVLDL